MVACGARADADSERAGFAEEAIQGGAPDEADDAVVAVLTTHRECTGVMVMANAVLTARHCVADLVGLSPQGLCATARFAATDPAARVFVKSGERSGPAARIDGYPVARIVTSESADVCGNDVALLVLQAPMPGAHARKLASAAVRGATYTAVGYGESGVNGVIGTRLRRGGLQVACRGLDCGRADVVVGEWMGEGGVVCAGDSGGPAIDADGHILGVVSRAAGDCGANAVYTDAANQRWLDAALAEEAPEVPAGGGCGGG